MRAQFCVCAFALTLAGAHGCAGGFADKGKLTQISKIKDEFGNNLGTMSSSKYCKVAIANVEERLALVGKLLTTKCKTPMVTNYAH